jgi:hypothetical protein
VSEFDKWLFEPRPIPPFAIVAFVLSALLAGYQIGFAVRGWIYESAKRAAHNESVAEKR